MRFIYLTDFQLVNNLFKQVQTRANLRSLLTNHDRRMANYELRRAHICVTVALRTTTSDVD